jgi:hypothetical protein
MACYVGISIGCHKKVNTVCELGFAKSGFGWRINIFPTLPHLATVSDANFDPDDFAKAKT